MKSKQYYKNSQGVSMLYVLAALIVTGFIGSAMIKMVAGDRTAHALYSTSASARSAAKSGIIDAISYFENGGNKDEILALLKAWVANPTPAPIWISGSTTKFVDLNTRNLVDYDENNDPKFKVRMLSFDERSFNITLIALGTGKGNARASITSVYNLEGLFIDREIGNVPSNAIQLDNGNFEFNCKLTINGNTAARKKMVMNADSAYFNGLFRLAKGIDNTSGLTIFNLAAHFDSSVYIETDLKFDGGSLTLHGNTTFTNSLLGSPKSIKIQTPASGDIDSIYMVGGLDNNDEEGFLDVKTNDVFLYGSPDEYEVANGGTSSTGRDIIINAGSNSPNEVPADSIVDAPPVDSLMEYTDAGFGVSDSLINFNKSVFDGKTYTPAPPEGTKITAAWLNDKYQSTKSSHYKNFMLMKFPKNYSNSTNSPFGKSEVICTAKVIIISEAKNGKGLETINLPKCDPNKANIAFYLEESSKGEVAIKGSSLFRGLVYIDKISGSGHCVIKAQKDEMEISGAVYYSPKARSKFDGKSTIITYSQPVINELSLLGIFSADNAQEELDWNPNYANLIAHLVSQSM